MSIHELLELEVSRLEGVRVVHVRGELDRLTAPDLAGALAQAPEAEAVVVDLRGVTYLDLGGVEALEQAAGVRRPAFIVVVDPTSLIRRVLEILALDQRTPVLSTLDEAVGRVRAARGEKPN